MIFQAFDTTTETLSFRLDAPDLDTATRRARQYANNFENLPDAADLFVCADPDQTSTPALTRYGLEAA